MAISKPTAPIPPPTSTIVSFLVKPLQSKPEDIHIQEVMVAEDHEHTRKYSIRRLHNFHAVHTQASHPETIFLPRLFEPGPGGEVCIEGFIKRSFIRLPRQRGLRVNQNPCNMGSRFEHDVQASNQDRMSLSCRISEEGAYACSTTAVNPGVSSCFS